MTAHVPFRVSVAGGLLAGGSWATPGPGDDAAPETGEGTARGAHDGEGTTPHAGEGAGAASGAGTTTAHDHAGREPAMPTVLAIHGITSSHLAWPLVAERIGGARLLAPDLRGRGRSNALPPPWGIRDHADDMARVLDAFGVERAVVVGHSMGGFVAARTAAQHPDRVAALVLVDGGLPLPFAVPEGVPAEEVPALLLGPTGERLTRLFPTRESYLDFWRGHPAFRDDWSATLEAYLEYDLDEAEGGFRSSSRLDAVAANIVQQDGGDGYREALAGIGVPVDFLRAPRGLVDETPGLYPDAVLDAGRPLVRDFRLHDVPGVNHYGIVLAPRGADRVAAVVRDALEAALPGRGGTPIPGDSRPPAGHP